MAREDFSERELPSAEVRRQILQRAGTVLDHARDLVARLDRYDAAFPPSERESVQVLERGAQASCVISIETAAAATVSMSRHPATPGHALAA